MKDIIEAMFETYPRFAECSLQTFDDNKDKKETEEAKEASAKLASISENKESNYHKLDELNLKGAGIFFSVNPMNPGKRGKDNVIGISSWICEVDGLDKELQKAMIKNCPLKPSLIIESKSSFHMYWFSKDGTKEKWYDIANGLRNYFDGDPAVVDISRVLRLPGYNHMKDPNDPYLITLYDYNGQYYTEEQMLSAYTDTRSITEIKQSLIMKESQARTDIGGDYYWDRVKDMDTRGMLEEISGTTYVSNDQISFMRNNNGTDQILVNGKSTGCWIDKNGKIGSKSGGGPNWTNRVFWYNSCNGRELAKWINDKHPEMVIKKTIPKKEKPKQIVDNTDMDFETITPFSWGLKSLDKRFGRFGLQQLIVTIGESQSGKTEFTFFQARKNADAGYKVCYIALEMNKKKMIERICKKRAGVSKEEWDNKTFTAQQKQIMIDKYNELMNYKKLEIISLSKPTIEDIKTSILEKKEEGYELFYIDNLGFINGDGLQEIELTAMAIRELKDITNNYKLSINLLHHFNKGNSKDRVGPRGMASIRSSGKIENDADYVLQVWRDLEEDIPVEDRELVGIYLQKDRERGDPSFCNIKFDKGDYKEYVKSKEETKKKDDPF